MAQLSTIVPVVIYLALSFLAALWARKQSQKTSDSHGFIEEYFIGGRSMGGFVLAMSIIASYTSASSFVGGPGVAYKLGLSWVLLAMIQVPTTFLTLGVLGKRFAIMARKTRAVTLTDFLRARYRSDAVVVLCSLALLVFFMAAMLAQFIGGARLFQAVTGYPYIVGLALFGFTVILYTAVGGFRAVVLTDAIQGMVMVFASVVVLVAVVNAGGGMERCVATLKAIDPGLITPTGPGGTVPQPMILSFWVLVGLGILGLPQTSQKCMGYKDSRSMHALHRVPPPVRAPCRDARPRRHLRSARRGSGHAHADHEAAFALLGGRVHRRAAGGDHVHGGLHAPARLRRDHQGSVHPLRAERRRVAHDARTPANHEPRLYRRHRAHRFRRRH